MSATFELEESLHPEYFREGLPYRYEVVDGQIVAKPPMSALANEVANHLHIIMGNHVLGERLGRSLFSALFKLPAPVHRNRDRMSHTFRTTAGPGTDLSTIEPTAAMSFPTWPWRW